MVGSGQAGWWSSRTSLLDRRKRRRSQYPQRVAYARSRTLDGPWTFEGIVNEVPGNCATNRPAIVEFADEWYFFYHNGVLPGGGKPPTVGVRRPVAL